MFMFMFTTDSALCIIPQSDKKLVLQRNPSDHGWEVDNIERDAGCAGLQPLAADAESAVCAEGSSAYLILGNEDAEDYNDILEWEVKAVNIRAETGLVIVPSDSSTAVYSNIVIGSREHRESLS